MFGLVTPAYRYYGIPASIYNNAKPCPNIRETRTRLHLLQRGVTRFRLRSALYNVAVDGGFKVVPSGCTTVAASVSSLYVILGPGR